MGLWDRLKAGIQIVVGGHSQGRVIVKGVTQNAGSTAPKQGEAWLHAYNTMPWLRGNVAKIAHGVASLEWGITRTMGANGMTVKRPDIQKGAPDYRRKALAALEEEGKAEAIFDHPFLTLWKNPCPALPGGAARKLAQVYYEIVGEVFFVVDRGPRDAWIKSDFTGRPLPTALWPIPPTWVKRFPTPDNPTFEIRHAALQLNDIPMSEVLWLKDPDPVNPYGRGVGLFNALSDELDSDENAARMISYSFYNRNRPDVLVSLPNASDQEVVAFRNDWVANLQGIQNVLKSHFVNVEAEVQQIGYDFREMQVIDLRRHTRDTIRQVPGVPPEMLGIQDQSNRSTIEAAEFIFNKHVVEPRAEIWREFLGSQLLCEFDPRAVLDYVSPVQEDKNFTLNVATGRPEVVKVNEVRKLAGLPALTEAEGGNLFFVNGSFTPSLLQAPAPGMPAPGTPGGAPGGPGSGLPQPGFDGGINVPGAPQMHLSVPGAAGSAESGLPAGTQAPAGATPPPSAPPAAPAAPGFEAAPKDPFAKGVKKRARRSAAEAALTPDQTIVVARWAKMAGYDLDLDLVTKTVPMPLSDKRAEEAARRMLAHLGGFPTKAWDPMFGPWSKADTDTLDEILKGFEEQPRDEQGRWTSGGGDLSAGSGAAREGFARRVDGDGTSSEAVRLSARAAEPKKLPSSPENHARFIEERDKNPRAKFLSPLTPADLESRDVFLSEDGKVGFTLTKDDKDFGNLFNNDGPKGAGGRAVIQGIKLGARTLDCFDGSNGDGSNGLPKLYAKYGFVEVARLKFNPEFAPEGWEKDPELSKKPDVVFMAYVGGPRDTIEERVDSFPPNKPAKIVDDYDAAKAEQESALKFTVKKKAPKVEVVVKMPRVLKHEGGPDHDQKSHGSWANGEGADEGKAEGGSAGGDAVSAKIIAEPTTQPEGGASDPDVEKDGDGDGVTDSARVGVPADEVPPPPRVPRLPNLTPGERAVEEAFAKAYEADPDKLAADFEKMVLADGSPAKFEADAAKNLFAQWKGEGLSPDERAEVRSTLNTALHQTANAIAKRAFLTHLDSLSPEMKSKGLLVTVGGCGAGKGFALKTLAANGFTDFNTKNYGVIWDSAGDQNATENPWLLEECQKRGIPVTYAYVSADPEVSWADPKRGVVARAQDPKDGRMVDAKVFSDSYVLGAKNHDAFHKANADKARFVFVQNGAKIEKLEGVPKSDLSRDRRKLHDFAVATVAKLGPDVPARIKRGALVGQRIWPRGRFNRRKS